MITFHLAIGIPQHPLVVLLGVVRGEDGVVRRQVCLCMHGSSSAMLPMGPDQQVM